MKLAQKALTLIFLLGPISFLFYGFYLQGNLSKLKLNMEIKSLHGGKVVTIRGDVFYKIANGLMVTHFTYPREIITITNAQGEFKNYNVSKNEVAQIQGADFSSKQSFLHLFLAGKTRDLGLRETGFNLSDTKIEDDVVVTTWNAPITKVELKGVSFKLAHKQHKPIFMGIYRNDTAQSKTYYSNFTEINGLSLPLNITEIQYLSLTDSLIIRKKYSDLRIDSGVEDTYLNFKIPSNARLVETSREFD